MSSIFERMSERAREAMAWEVVPRRYDPERFQLQRGTEVYGKPGSQRIITWTSRDKAQAMADKLNKKVKK